MAEFTVNDLKRILYEAAGVNDDVHMQGEDFADQRFTDLDYDSLAVLELSSRIEREYGITIPDGDLAHTMTLREAVTYVVSRLAEVEV
ncbi:acyl carrier protein [Streptomyces sp. NPDC047117]|uniref:acyl carrier protein n=1 Tax=unclassified Streptomyces TaxID=2593676 RepID=UPI0033D69ABF